MRKELSDLMEQRRRKQAEVERAKNELDSLNHAIEVQQRRCTHPRATTTYDPIYTPGYHDSGDPPGTMGVDRRLPMDVPSRTEKRWKRECPDCGNVEYTTRSKPGPEQPDFGGSKPW